ncbi:hypothetical protein B0T20DRAFT_159054 [Sordaria brevicollis]|uniref:Secreted protein n=1 Tax=Sordaria brevicollis TaxID=83679 RepID=A0AAE0PJ71_SORBR|nr:hypothetical protein B0T20DRAFT_159054 [Sordaria brevicollis]
MLFLLLLCFASISSSFQLFLLFYPKENPSISQRQKPTPHPWPFARNRLDSNPLSNDRVRVCDTPDSFHLPLHKQKIRPSNEILQEH